MKLSIIIPIKNEQENIGYLYQELIAVLKQLGLEYEIIAINDGSTDQSGQVLNQIAVNDEKFKVVEFNRNYGQTPALAAGFAYAQGDIIIPMDADLENDPNDVPRLLAELDKGYDIVSGWRKTRWQNKLWTRKIPSIMASWLISKLVGLRLHDYGCTLKAYRKEALANINLYGEMHRLIPALAYQHGAKVGEIVVNYRKRRYGQTKYGFSRGLRVILDLVTVKFLTKYATRPMHFFGYAGYILMLGSFLAGCYALYLKLFQDLSFISTPLPLLVVFLAFVGLQFILMGLLAEILVRIYYESGNNKTYTIKSKKNI